MRTILLPFCDDEVSQNAFELSTRLVREVNGYVEGLFVLRRPEILDGDGSMLADTQLNQLVEESQRIAERARLRFEECVRRAAIPMAPVSESSGLTAGWREIEGREQQVFGSHARLFELIVIGRHFGSGWLNWRVIV